MAQADQRMAPVRVQSPYKLGAHGGLLVSLVQRAASLHFSTPTRNYQQPDVLELKVHFFRPATFGPIAIRIEDVAVGRASSTAEARVYQGEKLSLLAILTMGDFASISGPSFETNWALAPPQSPASVERLARDADPCWISYQCPWQPAGYRRPQPYVKFFTQLHYVDPSFRDQWLTPAGPEPKFRFGNEHLGFVADMTFPILDNFLGEQGVGSHAACVSAGRMQQSDREAGLELRDPATLDEEAGFTTPLVSVTLSLNMEIKRKLPEGGVRWLFSRSRARQIKDGRMDNEVLIFDEVGALVAVVHQVHQLIELAKAPGRSAKI